MRYAIPAVVLAFLTPSAVLWAQNAPIPSTLHFEVASVRASEPPTGTRIEQAMAAIPGVSGGPGTSNPERIVYSHMPLRILMSIAYELRVDQISGPNWIDSQRFEISANLPPEATKEQVPVMLRNLLVDRFKITFHHELALNDKAYELTVAKSGPKLKAVVPDPKATKPFPGEFLQTNLDVDGFPVIPAGKIGIVLAWTKDLTRMTCKGCGLDEFIGRISSDLGVAVGSPPIAAARASIVDSTGLTEKYDFRLEYLGGPALGMSLRPPSIEAGPDSGPTLFTAVEQQLGLKLEKTKAMQDVLVIDRAERIPVEN